MPTDLRPKKMLHWAGPRLLRSGAPIVAILSIMVSQRWRSAAMRPYPDEGGQSAVHKEDSAALWEAVAELVPEGLGYELSETFATTADGYILRVHRLVHGEAQQPRPVVFMQHALMDSSAGWLLLHPDIGLAYMLAKAGFDVFMGNVRGNRFSRNHTTLDPSDDAFWAFSLDEHAALDLPAMLQRALELTGAETLQYVGYSQGTTMMLAALSTMPEVAAMVGLSVMLAPVAYVRHISSLPFTAAARFQTAEVIQRWGVREFGAHDPWTAQWYSKACASYPGPCVMTLQLMCGTNPTGANLTPGLVAKVVRYLPSGTSVRNMIHWGQGVRGNGLHKFDFGTSCPSNPAAPSTGGPTCNQHVYGSEQPPAYDLSAITTPMVLFTGGHDSLADPTDIAALLGVLQPSAVLGHYHVPDYAHLDFGMGADAHERVYADVLRVLRQGGVRVQQQHATY